MSTRLWVVDVGNTGTQDGAEASSGTTWDLVVDEDGSDDSNWTGLTSDGTVYEITASGSGTIARLSDPLVAANPILECEIRFTEMSNVNAQIGIGLSGASGNPIHVDLCSAGGAGTGAQARIGQFFVASYALLAIPDFVVGTWYKLRGVWSGCCCDLYLDDVLVATGQVAASTQTSVLCFTAYQATGEIRNVKVWTLDLSPPA